MARSEDRYNCGFGGAVRGSPGPLLTGGGQNHWQSHRRGGQSALNDGNKTLVTLASIRSAMLAEASSHGNQRLMLFPDARMLPAIRAEITRRTGHQAKKGSQRRGTSTPIRRSQKGDFDFPHHAPRD